MTRRAPTTSSRTRKTTARRSSSRPSGADAIIRSRLDDCSTPQRATGRGEVAVATRAQVLAMVENGVPYDEAARRLGIDPGLVYMIATGLPADGSDVLADEDLQRPGFVDTSTQHWSNAPTAENPTRNPMVLQWIKQRAHSDA